MKKPRRNQLRAILPPAKAAEKRHLTDHQAEQFIVTQQRGRRVSDNQITREHERVDHHPRPRQLENPGRSDTDAFTRPSRPQVRRVEGPAVPSIGPCAIQMPPPQAANAIPAAPTMRTKITVGKSRGNKHNAAMTNK